MMNQLLGTEFSGSQFSFMSILCISDMSELILNSVIWPRTFRNKLRKKPEKKIIILSDVESSEVCSIPLPWLDYENGRFQYPNSTRHLKKLVKTGETAPEVWPWYMIECIFNETGD